MVGRRDVSRHHGALCLVTGRKEALLDELFVKADALGSHALGHLLVLTVCGDICGGGVVGRVCVGVIRIGSARVSPALGSVLLGGGLHETSFLLGRKVGGVDELDGLRAQGDGLVEEVERALERDVFAMLVVLVLVG
jgi:hypothetical protein